MRASLLILALSGCVSVQHRIPRDALPSPANSYVGALLAKDSVSGFGLTLLNVYTGEEYVLEVDNKGVGLIAVPPGRYRVASWLTWSLTGAVGLKKPIPDSHPLSWPVDLNAGQVMFLGHLYAAHRHDGPKLTTFIAFRRITGDEAAEAFNATYPHFARVPFQCPLCGSWSDEP